VVLSKDECGSDPSLLIPIKIQTSLLSIPSRVNKILKIDISIPYKALRGIVILGSSINKLAVVRLSTPIIISYSGSI
jgi:hypothetical protein